MTPAETPAQTRATRTSSGYRLGRQLGRARSGEIVLTEAQWTELEALGTRRNVNDLSAGDRLMAEMRAWLEAGGDPNPQGNSRASPGAIASEGSWAGHAVARSRSPRPSGPNLRVWGRGAMSTTSAPVTGSWRRCEHGLKRAVIRTLRETRELLGAIASEGSWAGHAVARSRSPRPSGPNSRHFVLLDAGRSRGRRSNSSATSRGRLLTDATCSTCTRSHVASLRRSRRSARRPHRSAPWFLSYHAVNTLDYNLAAGFKPWRPPQRSPNCPGRYAAGGSGVGEGPSWWRGRRSAWPIRR